MEHCDTNCQVTTFVFGTSWRLGQFVSSCLSSFILGTWFPRFLISFWFFWKTILVCKDLGDEDGVNLIVSLADVSGSNDVFTAKLVRVVDCDLSTSFVIRLLNTGERALVWLKIVQNVKE